MPSMGLSIDSTFYQNLLVFLKYNICSIELQNFNMKLMI